MDSDDMSHLSKKHRRVDAASVARLLAPVEDSRIGLMHSSRSFTAHLSQNLQCQREQMKQADTEPGNANIFESPYNVTPAHDSIEFKNFAAEKQVWTAPTGNCGYFQGLLRSFGSTDPKENYMVRGQGDMTHSITNNVVPSSTAEDNNIDVILRNGAHEQICSDNGGCQSYTPEQVFDTPEHDKLHTFASNGCHTSNIVDESGYASSDSSLYDVNSDDEDYENGCNFFGEEEQDFIQQHLSESQETPVQGGHMCNDEDNICPENNENDTGNGEEHVEDCACIQGNPFMHVMTELGEGDGEEAPCRKRTRMPQGKKRPDSRMATSMGPIEIALRNAPYRSTKYIFQPVLGITFDCENEAYDFYNMYSWEVGFGIKKDTLVTNNEGTQTKRDLRCLCSGSDEKAKYKSKKTGCKAMIRLLRSKDDGWYISRFVEEHNHPLTETCGQTKEWKSHGRLDANAMDMIKYLRQNNVSLTKVHCIMGSMFGSMENIPVTKRSLRAICRGIARDQMDDDVRKTLAVFRSIRTKDPDFQFSVDLDEDDKIKTLLWINGKSRDQYKCFGDAITFDTTYCTNIYKMPFGLFVGVNNHFQTTILGGVFMKDETTRSFKWVFNEFVSLMGGKLPQTIFTDQCLAMKAALKESWPGVRHLLCKWHIFKDARAKLGPIYKKGSPFRKLFHKIINSMLTIDEFERAWSYMIKRFGLTGNSYLTSIYNNREKWAKPYFKGAFCARMASTQRSESANHMLKRFVPRNCSMNRFVVQFNKLLFDRNSAEDRAEFDTRIFNDKRDRAWPVEEHAKKFYTAAAYNLFRQEINRSTHYLAKEKIENKEYEIVHVKPDRKLPWDREKFTVLVINGGESYHCECGLYQHFGILCSHVLRVFVQLGVYEIPQAHIHKRWTRSARDILPERLQEYQKDTLCLNSMTYRHTYLYVNAMGVVQDGNKDVGAFEIVSKELKKIQQKLKAYYKAKEKGTGEREFMKAVCYTTESDVGGDSETDTEMRVCNSYGAAGSSAGMSDSELLRMKAPAFKRLSGRPKETRFKGTSDYYSKRKKKSGGHLFADSEDEDTNGKKRQTRCGECSVLGHTASQCKKKLVDLSTELPEF